MPLFTIADEKGNVKDNYLPSIERFRTPSELSTSVRFNDEIPLEKMRQYVKGLPWEVEFFSQYGNANDPDTPFDIKLPIGTQSYIRISKLRIFVQQPLNQTNIRDITLEAIINAKFRPRVHDLFIATLIGGRIGLFTVEEISIDNYNLHNIYTVRFKLINFIEFHSDLYNNLISKVIKNYVYNSNYIKESNGDILTRQEYALREDIQNAISDLTDYFFRLFLDPDSKFLRLPTNNRIHYVDQELNKFCRKVFSVTDYPELTQLQTIDYTMDKTVRYTIWDLLETRNPRLKPKVSSNIGFIPSPKSISNLNSLEAIYLDVHYVVDKTDSPSKVMGLEDVVREPDPRETVYDITYTIRKEDAKNSYNAMKLWDLTVPTLDFHVPIKEDDKLVLKPIKDVIDIIEDKVPPKEEPKVEQPMCPLVPPKINIPPLDPKDLDNINQPIPPKVSPKPEEPKPPKPIGKNIGDIRAHKRFNPIRPKT